MHVLVHIFDGLEFIKTEGIPKYNGAVYANRDDLLLLLKYENTDYIFLLGCLSRVCHAKCMWVYSKEDTFCPTCNHDSKW